MSDNKVIGLYWADTYEHGVYRIADVVGASHVLLEWVQFAGGCDDDTIDDGCQETWRCISISKLEVDSEARAAGATECIFSTALQARRYAQWCRKTGFRREASIRLANSL